MVKLPLVIYAHRDYEEEGEPLLIAEESLEDCAPEDDGVRTVGVYELKGTKRIKRAVEIVA